MRLIQLQENNFQPLIHDVIKTLSTLFVIEMLLYTFNSDPLMDKIFVRMTVYNLIGLLFFYFVVNKIIGTGDVCCTFMDTKPDEAEPNYMKKE